VKFETCRTIPADHRSLPGHFPGAPVVPGVVILDEVVATLSEWRRGSRVRGIPLAKFLLPLSPEQPFTIRLSTATEARDKDVDFTCCVGDQNIAEGRLSCTAP
jgi:3-hydroxymyristoyl/3-hydroxydecanoyl-(acyl carrier protein) dehydratases